MPITVCAADSDNHLTEKGTTEMTDYITRNLTADETDRLVRKLTVAVGPSNATLALRVIAELGLGIFAAEENPLAVGDQVRTNSNRVGEVLDVGQQGELAIISLAQENSIEALPVAALHRIEDGKGPHTWCDECQGTHTDAPCKPEHGPYYVSDEDVAKMHPRQAAYLMEVDPEARAAVTSHARFLQNISGGNLSGNIYNAIRDLNRAGSPEALMAQDREDNAKLMGGAMRNR